KEWDGGMGAGGGIGSMQWSSSSGRGGTPGAAGIPGVGNWTLGINFVIEDGQTYLISRDVKRNFTVTTPDKNYKTFRMWSEALGGGHPNFYFSPSNGRGFTE